MNMREDNAESCDAGEKHMGPEAKTIHTLGMEERKKQFWLFCKSVQTDRRLSNLPTFID